MSKNNNLTEILDLFKKGKLEEALVLCDKYQYKKNNHIIKNLKGAIYFKQKKFNLAKKNFAHSIELNKNFIDPYNNLYALLISTKEYNNLIIVAKKSLN